MWDKLSIKDKAKIIKMGVANGIRDLDIIRDTYNNVYAEGGDTNLLNNQDFLNQYGIHWDEDPLMNDYYAQHPSELNKSTTAGIPAAYNNRVLVNRYGVPQSQQSLNRYAKDYALIQPQVSRKEEREIEKAQTERRLAEFNSQVDNLFGFEWTMPHVVGGAVERAVERMFTGKNDFFGGRGDFFHDLLLGNSGIVTDNFAKEHPNWTTGLNVLFDFAKPLYKGTMAGADFMDNYLYGPKGKVYNWMSKTNRAVQNAAVKLDKFFDFEGNANRIRDAKEFMYNKEFNKNLGDVTYTYGPSSHLLTPEKVSFNEGTVVPMEGGFNLKVEKDPFTEVPKGIPDRSMYPTSFRNEGRTVEISNKLGKEKTILPSDPNEAAPLSYGSTPPSFPDVSIGINRNVENPMQFINSHGKVTVINSSPNYVPADNPARQLATSYINDLNQRLEGLATVEGSTRALANGIPVSPNDIEFLMPESYYNKVKSKFNIRSETPLNNGYGFKVEGSEFDTLPGGSADFEVIKNDPITGKATGDTAWELYEYLHPKEAKALKDEHLLQAGKSGKTSSYRESSLPVTAEELFEEYKNSDTADIKYLMDTQGSARNKYAQRRLDAALEGNPDIYYNSLIKKAKSNLPNFKTLEEQGINIDYTNVEANKKFLEAYNLPKKYATDPKRMKIIVEQNVYATQIGQRGWKYNAFNTNPNFLKLSPEERINYELNIKNTNTGGGDALGVGKNMTNQVNKTEAGAPYRLDVQSINQYPITYHPETIKTAEDILNQLNHLKSIKGKVESRIRTEAGNRVGLESQVAQIAKEEDAPFITGDSYYDQGDYLGGLDQGGLSNAAQYIGGQFHFYEPPMELRNAGLTKEYSYFWPIEENYGKTLLEELTKQRDALNKYRSDRLKVLEKLYNKNNRNKNLVDNTKIGLKTTALTIPIGGGILYGFDQMMKHAEKTRGEREKVREEERLLKATTKKKYIK